MKQIKFVRLAAAAALTAALLFTGCDGGGSTPTPRPDPDPSTSVTTSKADVEVRQKRQQHGNAGGLFLCRQDAAW